MAHIDLSREADAIVIAPASTDFLAKLAHGFADDLLSTRASRDCPLLVVPAMNRQMWQNPATQRNAAQLRADGVSVLGGFGRAGVRRSRRRPHARRGDLRSDRRALRGEGARAPARADHRPDVRTARPGARPHEPLERQDGLRARARRAAAGADVHLVAGPVALDTPWGVYARTCRRRSRCTTRSHRSPMPTSSSRWLPSPTGASPSRRAQDEEDGRPQDARVRREPRHPRIGRGAARSAVLRRLRGRKRRPRRARRRSASARTCRCWSATSAR